ncbi:hypothetical protein BJ170DRAFT_680829 [Xylariales sp. AK1849]|nr:hypothetical protein BJ170DRAFT_680829 [Xylariales sp. AK1849]
MVKDFCEEPVNTASTRNSKSRYILIVEESSVNKTYRKKNLVPEPLAEVNNDSLTQDSGIDVCSPKSPTTNEAYSLYTNSLAMNSKASRNTSVSREGKNQSTSQSFIDDFLRQKKRDAIDRLMEMLVEWLDSPTFNSHAPGTSGSSSSASSASGSNSSVGKTPQKVAGQKRSLRRDSFDGSDPDDDGNREDKRENKRTRVDLPNAAKFACPFFKRDPKAHKHRQACTGPGWTSISRLKEHIYRAHRQSAYKCNRCQETFKNGDKLEEHQQADEPCRKSKAKPTDGISEAQYQLLRKKSSPEKIETKRWEEVYRIIFPDAKVVPSPYYEYPDGKFPLAGDNGTLEFGEYVCDELIGRTRNALEVSFGQFEEGLRTQFLDIVRVQWVQIHEEYRQQHNLPKAKTQQAPLAAEAVIPTTIPGAVDNSFADFDFDSFVFGMNEPHAGMSNDLLLAGVIDAEYPYSSNISDSAYYSADSPKSFAKE